eukprot:2900025-Pleurochrysis_carterae.AAC.1
MWDIPRDPIGCILLAAMFYVVPVATIMETTFCMGLRAISEVVLKIVVSATASRACSCILRSHDLIPNMSDVVYSGVSPLPFRWNINVWMDYAM